MNTSLAKIVEALLAGDLDTLIKLGEAADKEIKKQRAEIELARVIEPSIDNFLKELTGGEDLNTYVTKLALSEVSEKDFDKMLDEAFAKSEAKRDNVPILEKAKKKAKESHSDMEFLNFIEDAILSDVELSEGIMFLIKKYESLERDMVKDAKLLKDKDIDMTHALLGGAASYNLVIEDLKRALR